MRSFKRGALGLPLLLLTLSVASMQASAQNAAAAPASASSDAQFVLAASAAGDTEIIASRLAAKQAQSDRTRTFAATMVRDHTAANEKLRGLAQKDGFALAGTNMVEQQPDLIQLQTLHGADFDKAYDAMMIRDHHKAIALFTQEASGDGNSDLKSFASQTLPTLQHHLAMAQTL